MIWTDKYKPHNIQNYYHEDYIKNFIKNIITKKILPHIIFFGKSGSGKTSAAQLICNKILNLNNEKQNNNLLIINASDEKSIKTIRDKIKIFINFKTISIKIIILDEADALSDESQLALRRIIEIYSKNVRFIMICNYINKLLYSLKSRFVKIKVNRLNDENIHNVCHKIVQQEQINILEEDLMYLYKISNMDLRKIIITLQKLHSQNINQKIERKHINQYFNILIDDKIFNIDNYMKAHKKINKLIANGYNSYDLLQIVYNKINEQALKEYKNEYNQLFISMAKINSIMSTSSNNYIQMMQIYDVVFKFNVITSLAH